MNVQKKLIRLIVFKPYTEHTKPIFRQLEIPNIEQINYFLTTIFKFRHHQLENLPEIFKNYFKTSKEIHRYNTRNSSKLYKSFLKTNYAKQTLKHRGVDIWNSLDCNYKHIKSYFSFKKDFLFFF